MGSEYIHKIPTIDLTKEGLNGDTSSWKSTSNDVIHALETYGCFVAVYDEVTPELHKEMIGCLPRLFELPYEIKSKNVSDKPHHGYHGRISMLPNFEGFGIDNPTLVQGCESFTSLMWPDGNDHFCGTAHLFANKVAGLNKIVMKMVCESYGIIEKEKDTFDEVASYLLRIMRYLVPKMDEAKLGNPPHTDKSFTSILHQNSVNGLEIQAKDGEWLKVELSSSTFLFMAGDAFMAWSNDRIHSANHRVTMTANETRYSLALFSFRGGMIEAPEELVDEDHPRLYKPFENIGLVRFYFTDEGRKATSILKAYCAA